MRRRRAIRVLAPERAAARSPAFAWPGIPPQGEGSRERLASGGLAALVHLGMLGLLLALAAAPAGEKAIPIWLLRELAPPPPEPEPAPEPLVAEAPRAAPAPPAPPPEPEPAPEPPPPAAKSAPPEPPPPRRVVQIDPLARREAQAKPPERSARPEPPSPAPAEPPRARPDLEPLERLEAPELAASLRGPRRSPHATLPLGAPRPALGFDALPGPPASEAEALPPAPARRSPALLAQAPRAGGPRPELAPPAAPAPDAGEGAARRPPSRSRPPAAAVPAPARPGLRAAALAPAIPLPAAQAPPEPERAAAPRSARPAAAPAASPARGREGELRGVPLGSLAACVSDREEDALKRRLLASLGAQEECASAAGRYRFVEAKNLNSFLIWVERAAGRGPADRCVELGLALDCVTQQARPQ